MKPKTTPTIIAYILLTILAMIAILSGISLLLLIFSLFAADLYEFTTQFLRISFLLLSAYHFGFLAHLTIRNKTVALSKAWTIAMAITALTCFVLSYFDTAHLFLSWANLIGMGHFYLISTNTADKIDE